MLSKKQTKLSAEILARALAMSILDKYNKFLLKEGCVDTDIICEHPTAIERFMEECYEKV